MFRRLIMASALSLMAISAAAIPVANAGQQYIDESGFAVSGYDPVAFFELQQTPLGTPQPHAVPGRADITAEYNGARWAFASEANRKAFLADPAKYAPAYDGHCAYGIAQGGKVPGNPNLWRIVDGKLYLNITPTVVGFWESDIGGNLDKSKANWSKLEAADSSSRNWTAMDDNKDTYGALAPLRN